MIKLKKNNKDYSNNNQIIRGMKKPKINDKIKGDF